MCVMQMAICNYTNLGAKGYFTEELMDSFDNSLAQFIRVTQMLICDCCMLLHFIKAY